MKTKFVDNLRDGRDEAGANISWGSVFAGVVTFIAVFITLSFIGSAIGFGLLQPTSDSDPVNGAGTGVMIWTLIALLLSFAAAGFMAGLTAKRVGLVHGFLAWATSTIALVVLITYSTMSVVSGAASMLGSVAGATGHGVASVAGAAGNAASDGVNALVDQVSEVDTTKLQADMKQVLRDTDQPELQPQYLEKQAAEAGDELKEAAKQIATNPGNAEQIVKDTAAKLKDRADKIGEGVDRDAIANAVAKNTDLNEQEAKEATDNVYEGYQKGVEQVKNGLDQASQKLDELATSAKQTVDSARQGAEDVSNSTAKASIWAFIGLLLSAAAASFAGLAGNRVAQDRRVQTRA